MACATFLLLTATVMRREDRDGYQGTHLFFMPRETWEMDAGRGMLYDQEHYREMDMSALAEEAYGRNPDWTQAQAADAPREVAAHPDAEESAQAREYAGEQDAWPVTQHAQGPILRKMPYSPNLTSNELPALYVLEPILPQTRQFSSTGKSSAFFSSWLGDVPSPPPRISTSLMPCTLN